MQLSKEHFKEKEKLVRGLTVEQTGWLAVGRKVTLTW
jgi:hypothetical protein